MRTFLLLSFLLPAMLGAQEFAPIGSIWHYTNIEDYFSGNQGYVTIESVGDTVIQNQVCRIMEETEYRTSGDTLLKRIEYLRINGDTVWRYADDEQFYVLYNFAAEIGDTWTSKAYSFLHNGDREHEVQVDTIMMSTINGYDLKTMVYSTSLNDLSYGFDGTVTEIIGGSRFMFPFNYGWQDFDIRTGLRCYSDPVFGTYLTGAAEACNSLITDLEEIIASEGIACYPNPSSGVFTIERSANHGYELMNIYDAAGKLILIEPLDASTTRHEVELTVKGFYYIALIGNGKRAVQKIVIH